MAEQDDFEEIKVVVEEPKKAEPVIQLFPLKYTGKRKHISQDWNHKRYVFNSMNGFICSMPMEAVSRLLMTGQYMPVLLPATEQQAKVIEEKKEQGLVCPNCGKVCKNKFGLAGHMRSHR